MDGAKTTAREHKKHLNLVKFGATYTRGFTVLESINPSTAEPESLWEN